MKKTTLATAISTALASLHGVAIADTTLYGSARASVDYGSTDVYDGKDAKGNDTTKSYDAWDVVNQASRLGVRGEEDLGGGMAAIYQYEFGVDLTEGTSGFDTSNRPKWVGLKGSSWGSFTLGTQWTPYYNVLGVGDIFNNAADTFSDPTYYLGNRYGRRMDNSILYSTPNWSGFTAQLMMVANGNGGKEAKLVENADGTYTEKPGVDNGVLFPKNLSDTIDMWNVSASYKNGPFFAGITGMWLEGNDMGITIPAYDGTQWGVAGGYNAGPIAVTLSYEKGDINRMDYIGETSSLYLTGQYTMGNNVIRAAYGRISPEDGHISGVLGGELLEGDTALDLKNQDSYNNYALGYQYNLSKRTRLWAEYIMRDGVGKRTDAAGVSTFKDGPLDKDVLSIGTRVDF